MLDNGNLYLIDTTSKLLPSAPPILEIGSFCGLSTNVLTHFKRKCGLKSRLVSCDKWEFENDNKDDPYLGASLILLSDYKAFVRESYIRNTPACSAAMTPFRMEATYNEFFAGWREKKEVRDVLGQAMKLGGPISRSYIDGTIGMKARKRIF
jgi:hypothetical protein